MQLCADSVRTRGTTDFWTFFEINKTVLLFKPLSGVLLDAGESILPNARDLIVS